jgi:hypothetical protein
MPCSILPGGYPSKSLVGIQKLIFVSDLIAFEFLFHWRKKVEVIGGEILRIGWLWHAVHAIVFEPLC